MKAKTKLAHTITRWLLAAVIFILIMTVTFAGVEGFNFSDNDAPAATEQVNASDYGTSDNPPAGTPEPGTLILLAGGIGALYLVRRKRKE